MNKIHVALNTNKFDESVAFYRGFFGNEPVKLKPGYAKFEPSDPSVNLSLNQTAPGPASKALPAHYGIQVKSSAAVAEATQRFRAAGLEPGIEDQTTCCYAVQDKAWVRDPDGNEWEVFVVTDADSQQRRDSDSTCCEAQEGPSACCAA